MENLLEVFTTTWNEPETLEKLIKWYRLRVPDCKITVNDNESIDLGRTADLCRKYGCSLFSFSTGGKMDEGALIYLRNNVWKNSSAQFTIVCDSDELVDVTKSDLLACEDGRIWNLCKCNGIELFGTNEDEPESMYGSPAVGYCKSVLFHRASVVEMNFAPGSHTCSPVMRNGFLQKWSEKRFNLFHTKWQNLAAGLTRQHMIHAKGRSQDSIGKGWGFHYDVADEEHYKYFQKGFEKRERY